MQLLSSLAKIEPLGDSDKVTGVTQFHGGVLYAPWYEIPALIPVKYHRLTKDVLDTS